MIALHQAIQHLGIYMQTMQSDTDTSLVVIKRKTNRPRTVLLTFAFIGFVAVGTILNAALGPMSWMFIIPANIWAVMWIAYNHKRICVIHDKAIDRQAKDEFNKNPTFRAKLLFLRNGNTTPDEAIMLSRMLAEKDAR